MKLDQLVDIFAKQIGARKDGTAYVVPSDHDATLFVTFPGDTLTVGRITRLEVVEPFIYVDTAKGERYILAAEDIRAVKIEKGENTKRERSAGFGR